MSSRSPDEGRAPRRTVGLSNILTGRSASPVGVAPPASSVGGSLEGRGGRNVGELGATIGEVTLPVGAAVERRRGHGHGCHSISV